MIRTTRRGFLGASVSAMLLSHLPSLAFAQQRESGYQSAGNWQDPDALTLWYRVPARQWVDALPLGNGRLGAMVWGGTSRERLQLNDDTLFAGSPYDANPDESAQQALAEVRKLIFDGEYKQAETLANAKLMSNPVRQMPYQALGDLWLDMDELGEISAYRRELELDTAITRTRFKAGTISYQREVLVSPVDHCLALRLSADQPGTITGWVSAATDHQHQISADGVELLLHGRNGSRFGIEAGLDFALRVRLIAQGGKVLVDNGRLRIEGADELLLLASTATSYVRYDDVSADPDAITASRLEAASHKSWEQLRDAHVAEHQRLFRRVHLDLGHTPPASRSTDSRVSNFAIGEDPALAAMYFQFGRYLLIASSRPGSQPANLQGIWNDLLDPPWSSKWTININTQMNYWPAQITALPELVEPLEKMLFELAETGARTAKKMYGAPGWVVHHNTDLWRQTSAIDAAAFGLWPMGGAWLLMHLWDHWDYGRDIQFLRRVYPLFKGSAEFYAAVLQEDPKTGELVTNPSLSPENQHPFGSTLCAGPAMDSQILRDLFDSCIQACELLDVDHDFAAQLRTIRARLPKDRIGQGGQLQEWREDWDLQAPAPHHRHVSHLYGLFPSNQINVRDTPELAAAAQRSLETRGDNATGWGIGWRLNLWARLRDGDHAYRILQGLLSPERTYPNLFDAHPPFQIDGNFGGTAGITEMLMQSWGGSIFLLPALPSAWPSGRVAGLRARNTAHVDMHWNDGQLQTLSLHSEKGGQYRLEYRDHHSDWSLQAGESLQLRWSNGRLIKA